MGDLLNLLGNWVVWAVLAGGLAVAELLTLDFVLIMLAGGATAGAIAAAVSGSPLIAVVVATVAALALLGLVRPYAVRHYRKGPNLRTGVDALVGQQAVVTERVDSQNGRVEIHGEVWSARAYDESLAIEPGRTVDVMKIDGTIAYVYDVEKLELG